MRLLIFSVLFVSVAFGSQNWYYLKLPFAINPLFGFYDQPRTVEEALDAGWTPLDDAADCKNFNGGK